ncbi:trimeric intracellular cation channel family protein [Nocardia sp. CDC160]|uniref:trimeric intracellular cation channel family protein n=1 Tax=Nocardia sp. CDC160 TaxID=3112166 RepID=UPI002DBA28AB|nr:TRIC cation channel family protein [Nocardia sp. CDC160]MEC3917800.1 TRIC cation channel family protein [Nocardia sp. CDC160]
MTALLHIPVGLDLAAVAVGALAGALTATGRAQADRIDVIGVAVIAIATGLGGSILRDCVLGQTPAALRGDGYLLTALLAAGIGTTFAHALIRVSMLIALLDAGALGLYLVLGITKAQLAGVSTGAAVLVGIVACTGGGVVRDLLLGDPVALVRIGSWYVTAALGAAGVFLLCQPHTSLTTATIVTVAAAFVLRAAALRWAWLSPAAGRRPPRRVSVRR